MKKVLTAVTVAVLVGAAGASGAHAAPTMSPVAAVASGVGAPGKATPGKLKTTCGLTPIAGVSAAGWSQRSSAGRAWAWQGRVQASADRALKRVVSALDRCPGLGVLTTDWDSDGLEEKTVMLTGIVDGRAVTVLVYSHGQFITVAGAENTKPYRQERDVLVKTMLAQGVQLSPIPGT